MLSVVRLKDVNGAPMVKMELPSPIRIGERVRVGFRLERLLGGRREVLEVNQEVRVTAVALDASTAPPRQLLDVETTLGAPPVWKAVKKRSTGRRLAPARYPRTPI